MQFTDIIGIDIGGTKCAVSIPSGENAVSETARFPTADPQTTIARLLAETEALGPGARPAIGISCGGPLDAEKGLILSPPNLPGWDGIAICDAFTRRFGGAAWLMNDANACALAEWRFGAGRGTRSMVFLTMGTGMGGGLILDGRLYEGANGNAGEVGHLRLAPSGPIGFGKAGSFEGFCSGGGLAQLARARVSAHGGSTSLRQHPVESLTARDVGEAADQGDPLARAILEEVGGRLGEGLALLVDILNPERIVIGSIFSRCGRHLTASMLEALRREALPQALAVCSVVPATLGDTVGSYAAVALARYKMDPQT